MKSFIAFFLTAIGSTLIMAAGLLMFAYCLENSSMMYMYPIINPPKTLAYVYINLREGYGVIELLGYLFGGSCLIAGISHFVTKYIKGK